MNTPTTNPKSFSQEKISVIIPLRNEATNLAQFLDALYQLPIDEIICVDGGSDDGSAILLQAWAKHSNETTRHIAINASPGRASQMNAGAKQATSEILLFLHTDTQLPRDSIAQVLTAMTNRAVPGGAFRLHIDSKHPFLLWVTWIANLRSLYWTLPYGDQAIFVRRSIFERLGGYPDLPLMEDVALIRRLKKVGRIVILKKTVTTSARRWQQQGYFFTSFRNMLILFFYFLGISPKRLAKWYDSNYKT